MLNLRHIDSNQRGQLPCMRDQQCGHTGCPEQITQMRQGMGSLEAAGCPPCTHTSHTHNWLSTDFFFSLWTYTGAQEGGIIEWKTPEKLPITHHPGGPEGMHKPHHQSWWQGEKWSHLLRAVLLQRMFSVPYGEFFCILPINYICWFSQKYPSRLVLLVCLCG